MKVYLDNAATTPLDTEVFEAMKPFMLTMYGNPSSTHSEGRVVRAKVEEARKKVAELLNTTSNEIFFTSGGTEADNTAITCAARAYNIQHIITSEIEHHAVADTVERLKREGVCQVKYLQIDNKGHYDLNHLEHLIKVNPKSMVSLMHANNEVGTLNDINKIGEICNEYGAIFHSDTVQTIGHYRHNLQSLKCHFVVGSAHKFNGPKGIGFLRVCKTKTIGKLIEGGGQERNQRAGTENVYGIIGLAKALDIAYRDMDTHQKHIQSLKSNMIKQLKLKIPGVEFNGDITPSQSLYTILNVSLPPNENNDMLLFNLDLHGIAASGGSACNSGAIMNSHVMDIIHPDSRRKAIRFSFGKYNTIEEVSYTVAKLVEVLAN